MKINKILIRLFVLLLTVVVVESVYYAKIKDDKGKKELSASVKPTPVVTRSAAQMAYLTPNPNNPREVDAYYGNINQKLAIDPKVIDTLLFYKKGILKSSIITNIHSGKIIEVDLSGGNAYYQYYKYVLKIMLQSDIDASQMHGFYFSKADLQNATIEETKNGKKRPLTIKDLKEGDEVVVEHTIDALGATPAPLQKDDIGPNYLTWSVGYDTVRLQITRIIK